MNRQILWDEKTNKTTLVTKDGNMIKVEPITSEEASQIEAEERF